MDVRFRRPTTTRELRENSSSSSTDGAKVMQQPRAIKNLQVVYYLSRNGHLEHPHYMEITHFASHPLRLRDVMDRLTALRGKGMPALYSWSCKRSYKNGYVWNDLAENDIIYPAEGAEYVLKGSELVEGCSAERLDQLQMRSNQQMMQQQDSNFGSKRRSPLAPTRSRGHDHHHREADKYREEDGQDQDSEDEQEEQELVDYEDEKTSYTSSTTPHSRCSRGVSTDELEDPPQTRKSPTVSTHPESSPPPPPTPTPSVNNIASNQPSQRTNLSTWFEDGDPVVVSDSKSSALQSKNSVLLQLIACGSSAVAKAKNAPCVSLKQHTTATDHVKKSSESFRKEVVYKAAVKVAVAAEEDMIRCMSENPRFGNLQAEEKEYFSGSIVDDMKDQDRVLAEPMPGLKRSNSYNEQRSSKAGFVSETVEEEKKEKAAVKGKCIPRKLYSSAASKQSKK
ncbi:protein SOSEKI 2 [Pyrus communis]|uniref:protein SOSEKI 2 n=1 Tax=Pyrus communis TaxID=23211 RepID=UPI0035C134E8